MSERKNAEEFVRAVTFEGPDKDGYPTEADLEKIRNWDVKTGPVTEQVHAWLLQVRGLWIYPSYWTVDEAVDHERREYVEVFRHEISTGGWSGHEDIIDALQQSIVWPLTFHSHRRGGHYVLLVPK